MNRFPDNVFVIGDHCAVPARVYDERHGIHLTVGLYVPATVIDVLAPMRRVAVDNGAALDNVPPERLRPLRHAAKNVPGFA